MKKKLKGFQLIWVGIIFFSLLPLGLNAIAAPLESDSMIDASNDICSPDDHPVGKNRTGNHSIDAIDIVKIARRVSTDTNLVELVMIVNGEIKESDDVHYIIYYNNSYSKYKMDYSNGENVGFAYNIGEQDQVDQVFDPVVISDSIMVTYPLLNDSYRNEDLEAVAYEIKDDGVWADYVPNQLSSFDPKPFDGNPPFDSNGTDDQPNQTPGFTILVVFSAIILFAVIRKKR